MSKWSETREQYLDRLFMEEREIVRMRFESLRRSISQRLRRMSEARERQTAAT